jgi:hypothetical protein
MNGSFLSLRKFNYADIGRSEAEDEDDEETREWEMAQARRAGRWEDEQPEKPEKRGHQAKPSTSLLKSMSIADHPQSQPLGLFLALASLKRVSPNHKPNSMQTSPRMRRASRRRSGSWRCWRNRSRSCDRRLKGWKGSGNGSRSFEVGSRCWAASWRRRYVKV